LKLTKEEDRLPALSAVVKGLEDVLKDTYLGGLWRLDLELGLTWISGKFAANPTNPGCLTAKYRAPSWSWASIKGPVDVCYDRRDRDEFEPIFQILDAGTTLAGVNPRGNVGDGFVKVSGHLVAGSLSVPEVLQVGLTNTMSSIRFKSMAVQLLSALTHPWSNTNPRFKGLNSNMAMREGRYRALSNASPC